MQIIKIILSVAAAVAGAPANGYTNSTEHNSTRTVRLRSTLPSAGEEGAQRQTSLPFEKVASPSHNTCGPSTFEDKTAGEYSPDVAECRTIADDNKSWTGYYSVYSAPVILAAAGACTFEVRPASGSVLTATDPPRPQLHVGSSDVSDLVRDAITKFGDGGQVSATGNMTCRFGGEHVDVRWRLFTYGDGS